MSNIDWSAAPAWATKPGIVGAYREYPIWFNDVQYVYCDGQQEGRAFQFDGGCTYKPGEIYAITERPAPQWSGEGLPPVGTICEVHSRSGDPYWERHIGKQVKIVAHSVTTSGDPVAVYETKDSDGFNEYHGLVEGNFRRIKTPAQIAAELRTATIKRAAELCPFPRADSTLVVLEALYDNGILKGDAK